MLASSAAVLKYPSQLPRYTSYPTAPQFQAISLESYHRALDSLGKDEAVSLYLHIPFCKKLCWFCGCNTKITEKYAPIKEYLHLLLREISLIRQATGNHKLCVSHIHFGGGSPTVLECEDFETVMRCLHENFRISDKTQIAIEVDPRTASEAKIAAYAKLGVNRVSIGVQDFNYNVQVAINRIQSFGTVYEVVRLCRDYGINQINFDLIYGLPEQTSENFKTTIEQTLLLSPDRIAVFGYAHVPWKKKNIRLIKEEELPSEEQRLDLCAIASQMLKAAGYVAIGIDHFAKPNDPMTKACHSHTLKRNFQGYTVDSASTMIGIGASAIGNFAQGYFQNHAGVDQYRQALENNCLPTAKGYSVSDADLLRRNIIEEIMCYLKIDFANFPAIAEELAALTPSLQRLVGDGLIEMRGSVISVNPEAPQAARILCSLFDSYYVAESARHGKVA